MKGSFELAIVLLVGFPMLLLGINFVQIMMSYNNARHLSQFVVNTIEDQNRYDDSVNRLIEENAQICNECVYKVEQNKDKYKINIEFNVGIPLLNYKKQVVISNYTQPIINY